MPSPCDLIAYLSRIGLPDGGDLARLHRAHVTAIPFENLDPHRGVPVSLDLAALERKLIAERRGGYCFEQNLLFGAALRALGARVEPMLARVRLGRGVGADRPRTHLVLRVQMDGRTWLADVGFGNGTLLEPIPFGPGEVHQQSGWRYRLVDEGGEHVLQLADADGWVDQYGFVPEPVPFVDLETSNWYACTFPRSPFVTGLLIAAHAPDGSRLVLTDRGEPSLSERAPGQTRVTAITRQEIPALLHERFGLPEFGLNRAGRVVPAAGPDETPSPPATTLAGPTPTR